MKLKTKSTNTCMIIKILWKISILPHKPASSNDKNRYYKQLMRRKRRLRRKQRRVSKQQWRLWGILIELELFYVLVGIFQWPSTKKENVSCISLTISMCVGRRQADVNWQKTKVQVAPYHRWVLTFVVTNKNYTNKRCRISFQKILENSINAMLYFSRHPESIDSY